MVEIQCCDRFKSTTKLKSFQFFNSYRHQQGVISLFSHEFTFNKNFNHLFHKQFLHLIFLFPNKQNHGTNKNKQTYKQHTETKNTNAKQTFTRKKNMR